MESPPECTPCLRTLPALPLARSGPTALTLATPEHTSAMASQPELPSPLFHCLQSSSTQVDNTFTFPNSCCRPSPSPSLLYSASECVATINVEVELHASRIHLASALRRSPLTMPPPSLDHVMPPTPPFLATTAAIAPSSEQLPLQLQRMRPGQVRPPRGELWAPLSVCGHRDAQPPMLVAGEPPSG